MSPTNKVGNLKQIKWRDSKIYLTQCSKDDEFSVEVIISVGYVVSEDRKQVVLAGDVLSNGDVRRVIVIPKENIIK